MLGVGGHAQQHWYGLRWFEWVGVVGVVLTLAGIGMTFRQARKARSAAEEALVAAGKAHEELSLRQALLMVPRMRGLAADLDAALDAGEDAWVRRTLDAWRWDAGQLNGLLRQDAQAARRLLRSLTSSASLAALAMEESDEEGKGRATGSDEARSAINEACTELSVWAGECSARLRG